MLSAARSNPPAPGGPNRKLRQLVDEHQVDLASPYFCSFGRLFRLFSGHDWLLPAAFFVVYFGWGSTFLAGRIALDAAPPFLLAAARSFAAGLALYAWAAFTGRLRPASWRAWGGAAVIGSLFFLGGYGLLFVGMPLGLRASRPRSTPPSRCGSC